MSGLIFLLFLAVALCLVVGVPLVKSVLVFTTTPPADLARIKANLGGIIGPAGVFRQVLNVRHAGGEIAGRYTPPRRKYLVVIARPDCGIEHRTVWIDVTFFGYGALTVDAKDRPIISRA